jgi:hypothetical protein
MQHGTKHNGTQHNDTQHNDAQHNDAQHNDIHHNDTKHKRHSGLLQYGTISRHLDSIFAGKAGFWFIFYIYCIYIV